MQNTSKLAIFLGCSYRLEIAAKRAIDEGQNFAGPEDAIAMIAGSLRQDAGPRKLYDVGQRGRYRQIKPFCHAFFGDNE